MDGRYRADKGTDLQGFLRNFRHVWTLCGYKEPILRRQNFSEWEQYPVVTYWVRHREPAAGFRETKPRIRGQIQDPADPQRFVTVLGQNFDYVLAFTAMAKSPDEAQELLDRLEDFMLTYTGYFKQKGVGDIVFQEQLEDEVITSWRDPVAAMTVLYRVRLERLTSLSEAQLELVLVDYKIDEEE